MAEKPQCNKVLFRNEDKNDLIRKKKILDTNCYLVTVDIAVKTNKCTNNKK